MERRALLITTFTFERAATDTIFADGFDGE